MRQFVGLIGMIAAICLRIVIAVLVVFAGILIVTVLVSVTGAVGQQLPFIGDGGIVVIREDIINSHCGHQIEQPTVKLSLEFVGEQALGRFCSFLRVGRGAVEKLIEKTLQLLAQEYCSVRILFQTELFSVKRAF